MIFYWQIAPRNSSSFVWIVVMMVEVLHHLCTRPSGGTVEAGVQSHDEKGSCMPTKEEVGTCTRDNMDIFALNLSWRLMQKRHNGNTSG